MSKALLTAGFGITERDSVANEEATKRAVIYLRVSTASQVKTDYNPEGISLPAQRQACQPKAASLGAEVVREFIEPGRTATDIDHRPVFREMIAWVKDECKAGRQIDYVVVYMFNRIFRSSHDAQMVKHELKKRGVRLVSTTLDLGEGATAELVESIMHAVDQHQSEMSGADISYKMAAKAKNGGTLGRAPIGYVNVRDTSEGRNIGTVKFDRKRAPLIRMAFELYATDNYSLKELSAELTRRGLLTRPGRYPACPISDSKLAALLRNPYYIGYVTYKGELIKGKHKALIGVELFDQVQEVLDKRRGRGIRQRRHDHYLKGMLWCGECHDKGVESRICLQWSNGHGGRYLYFFCLRKQDHQCDSHYNGGDMIEDAIVEHYATVRFPEDMAARLRKAMHDTIAEEERTERLARQQLTTQLRRLDSQEENLLNLAADGEMPTEKIKRRLGTIKRQREKVTEQLAQASGRLAYGVELIERALLLLDNPQALYKALGEEQRRMMNQAIFERFYVIEDRVTEAVLRPPFDELIEARDEAWAASRRDRSKASKSSAELRWSRPLAAVLWCEGSKTFSLVEVMGFEPTASALRTLRSAN
jgi:site-specific DNA recombinase